MTIPSVSSAGTLIHNETQLEYKIKQKFSKKKIRLPLFSFLKKITTNETSAEPNGHKFRGGIFGFCLLSFPQNGRKIYRLRPLSLSKFVYFLTREPSMFAFTEYFLL